MKAISTLVTLLLLCEIQLVWGQAAENTLKTIIIGHGRHRFNCFSTNEAVAKDAMPDNINPKISTVLGQTGSGIGHFDKDADGTKNDGEINCSEICHDITFARWNYNSIPLIPQGILYYGSESAEGQGITFWDQDIKSRTEVDLPNAPTRSQKADWKHGNVFFRDMDDTNGTARVCINMGGFGGKNTTKNSCNFMAPCGPKWSGA